MSSLDCPMGIVSDDNVVISKVEKPTVASVLSGWGSCIGLDIAPNHTGVFTWDDNKKEYTTYGFKLDDSIMPTDVMYDAKARLFFKKWYREHFSGMHFSHVCVEDTYGGENYETSHQLINLNSVFDELLLEGIITYDEVVRVKPTTWMRGCNAIYHIKGGYSSKFKTQAILKYLGFEFFLQNDNLSGEGKKSIFFEDICDACGICLGIRMLQKQDIKTEKSRSVALSQVEVYFFENVDDMNELHGGFALDVCTYEVILNKSCIEKEIKRLVSEDANQIYYTKLENKYLGRYGIKQGFQYFNQGYGWLVFFHKSLAKQ